MFPPKTTGKSTRFSLVNRIGTINTPSNLVMGEGLGVTSRPGLVNLVTSDRTAPTFQSDDRIDSVMSVTGS